MTNRLKELVKNYVLLKNPTSSHYCVRQGFYAIIDFKSIKQEGNKWKIIAKAEWTDDITLDGSLTVEVNLSPLYNWDSEGPSSISPDELKGAIIEIKNTTLIDKEYNGIPSKAYKIEWDISGFVNDESSDSSDDEMEEGFDAMDAEYQENEILQLYYDAIRTKELIEAEQQSLEDEFLSDYHDLENAESESNAQLFEYQNAETI